MGKHSSEFIEFELFESKESSKCNIKLTSEIKIIFYDIIKCNKLPERQTLD